MYKMVSVNDQMIRADTDTSLSSQHTCVIDLYVFMLCCFEFICGTRCVDK